MKQRYSKLTEDRDKDRNALYQSVLVDDLMTREAIASVALDHDPQYQTFSLPDEYRECSVIELTNSRTLFLRKNKTICIVRDIDCVHHVTELAHYISEGVLYVRFTWAEENFPLYFSTNEKYVVWQ